MTGSKELFADVFSRHAAAYQARHELIRRQGQSRGRARLLQLLAVEPGELALDLCCGPGNLAAEILEQVPGARVIGVDLAPGMLVLAAAGMAAEFVCCDAETLPLRSASFDAVACGHGLQFVPDLSAVLREARRVLRPGGRFAASVPQAGRAPDRGQEILDRLLPPFPATPDREATLRVVRDPAALAAAAEAAGFREAACEEVDGEVVWTGPREMFEQSLGWWSCAALLEDRDEAARRAILEAAVAEFEAVQGEGPVRIPAYDLVLYARA